MSNKTLSFIVRCKRDLLLTNAILLYLVRVDTNVEVRLSEGTFLLRIATDEQTAVERCFIRHLTSGREAYVQGGPNLRAFVEACLLNNDET
ncbi:MAG: hypothetical protein NVSMB38_44490 [Ktedonobacteraceae bacterium]